jgi:MarR family transcriptional regulator, temperature-dependent positive regulator of motility
MPSGHRSESVVHLLHQAAQKADATFMRHSVGLSPRLFEILKAVAGAGGLSQSEIMAATGIDRSSVASLVAKLIEMECLTRNKRASDNRSYAVYLTAHGEAAFRRNLAAAEQADADLLLALKGKERSGFLKVLRTLANSTHTEQRR